MLKMVYEYKAGNTFNVTDEIMGHPDYDEIIEHKRRQGGAELGMMIADKKPWNVVPIINGSTGKTEGELHTLEVFVMTADELKKVVWAHGGEMY